MKNEKIKRCQKMINLFTFFFITFVAIDGFFYKITIKKLNKFATFYVFCKTVREIATNFGIFTALYP